MSASVPQTDDSIEPASTRRSIGSDAQHAVLITDPADFDDAVDAAATLGMELAECVVEGAWKTHPTKDVGLSRGFNVEIETAGRTWFHLRFDDGEVIRAKPRSSDALHDGYLRLLFE